MDNAEFNPFEQFVPPKSLAERLKAEANGHAEVEAASFMAERFAPISRPPAVTDPAPSATSPPPLQEPVRTFEPVVMERSSGRTDC